MERLLTIYARQPSARFRDYASRLLAAFTVEKKSILTGSPNFPPTRPSELIEPLSEWALINWAPRTALPEMLDLSITKTTKDRLYRTSDLLVEQRSLIEQKLRIHEADLFATGGSVILYDVTNSHFEGECIKNSKAKRGKNKQKRNDCKQV